MLPELSSSPLSEYVAALNDRHRNSAAIAVLDYCLTDFPLGKTALVSSFGAESVVLLHLVSLIDRSVPVLFLDTQMLFPETLAYQVEVAQRLKLADVRIIRPDRQQVLATDPDNTLHQRDHDACCDLRKTQPLASALASFDTWISGRKRFQGTTRAALEVFETDGQTRIKVNPLAHWSPQQIRQYILDNQLPRHPLVSRGYPSIGCAPCTSRVQNGEDPRAGRWRGHEKVECGIHFINGQLVHGAQPQGETP
ncbi:MAG: phosphoadenylyl-sulfate reductase [Robiginitomaculum sp.]|nr:phosphoadenylyl-sulfate reductase [Robiginitomaculum sp.]MDQ7077206.1 phosphoadenylyl-sulfate reductase [Robiginitomaculum sp.]